MNEIKIDKNRLMEIAVPPSEEAIKRRDFRKQNRALISASTVIAAKITKALREKAINHSEFAKLLGVTPANVTRYLSGKANFELKTLIDIERVLGISLIDRQIDDAITAAPAQPKEKVVLMPIKIPDFNNTKTISYEIKSKVTPISINIVQKIETYG